MTDDTADTPSLAMGLVRAVSVPIPGTGESRIPSQTTVELAETALREALGLLKDIRTRLNDRDLRVAQLEDQVRELQVWCRSFELDHASKA